MESIEKRLKDYNGCQIWKTYDILSNGKKVNIVYMATDYNDNMLNCLDSLSDLKKWIDNYLK